MAFDRGAEARIEHRAGVEDRRRPRREMRVDYRQAISVARRQRRDRALVARQREARGDRARVGVDRPRRQPHQLRRAGGTRGRQQQREVGMCRGRVAGVAQPLHAARARPARRRAERGDQPVGALTVGGGLPRGGDDRGKTPSQRAEIGAHRGEVVVERQQHRGAARQVEHRVGRVCQRGIIERVAGGGDEGDAARVPLQVLPEVHRSPTALCSGPGAMNGALDRLLCSADGHAGMGDGLSYLGAICHRGDAGREGERSC